MVLVVFLLFGFGLVFVFGVFFFCLFVFALVGLFGLCCLILFPVLLECF